MFGSIGARVRGYLVFTSPIYRIAMYLAIPVALVAFGTWGGAHAGDIGLLLAVMVLTDVEVLSDSWLFGGIQAKDSEKIDYLKSSGRGMALMRNALAMDLVRRLLNILWVTGISFLLITQVKGGLEGLSWTAADFISCGGTAQELGFVLYLALLCYTLSALGTFLSRYGVTIYGNLLVGYGAMVLAGLAGAWGPVLLKYPSNSIFLLDLLCAAAGIGVSILTVRAAMRKVEGGYYDE